MIRANKLGGGTSITCLGTAYNTGGASTSCAVTNPQDATDTHETSSAAQGTNMSLSGGFGTVTNMGINPQSKPFIRILPSKNCTLKYVSLNTATVPPSEVSLTTGTEYDFIFSSSVAFIIY